jgi:hypothetical protein
LNPPGIVPKKTFPVGIATSQRLLHIPLKEFEIQPPFILCGCNRASNQLRVADMTGFYGHVKAAAAWTRSDAAWRRA